MLPINTIIIKTQTAEILQQWTTGDHVTTHALKHHYWPSTIRPFDLKSNQIDPCLKYENCMRYGCLEGASGNIQKAPGPINRIELSMNQMVDANKCKQHTEISCQVRWPLGVSLRIKLPSPPMQQHIPSLDNHLQPHCFVFWSGKFSGEKKISSQGGSRSRCFFIRLKVQSHGMANMVRTSITGCVFFLLGAFDPMLLLLIVSFGKKTNPSSITFDRYPGCTSEVPKAPTGSELTLKKKVCFAVFYTCSYLVDFIPQKKLEVRTIQ